MRTAAAAATLALAFAAAPSLAHADEDVNRVDQSPRWQGAFGMRVGSFRVGSFAGMGFGFHLDAGKRYDRLLVYGEYSFLSISNAPDNSQSDSAQLATNPSPAPPEIDGMVQRIGANARYSVGKITGDDAPLRGDFWLEAGLGEEFIRWDLGGAMHRPDVAFGFGGQFSGRFGREHDHHADMFYALRVTLARAPSSYTDRAPTCAGPCDTPTTPIGIDRSFLFNLGIVFGN
jgi:hypothetical protein